MSPPKKQAEEQPQTTPEPGTGDAPADLEAANARIAELEAQLQEAATKREELESAANAQLDELQHKLAEAQVDQGVLDAAKARIADLEAQLANGSASAAETVEQRHTGPRKTITYLGRPDMVARDENGEATEDDVYSGFDGTESITLAVGQSALVSEEKAQQLAADFPGAFDVDSE